MGRTFVIRYACQANEDRYSDNWSLVACPKNPPTLWVFQWDVEHNPQNQAGWTNNYVLFHFSQFSQANTAHKQAVHTVGNTCITNSFNQWERPPFHYTENEENFVPVEQIECIKFHLQVLLIIYDLPISYHMYRNDSRGIIHYILDFWVSESHPHLSVWAVPHEILIFESHSCGQDIK